MLNFFIINKKEGGAEINGSHKPSVPKTNFEYWKDDDIWKAFKEGNRDAFSHIFQSNIKALLNYGQKIINDRDIVSDNIQDLFIEIWKYREGLSNTDSIKYYLIKSLRYKLIKNHDKIKRLNTENGISQDYDFQLSFSHESEIILKEVNEEQKKKIAILLSELSAKQREIIFLRFYNNLNFDEISSIMNLNKQSAYNLLHRALKELSTKIVSKNLIYFTAALLMFTVSQIFF